MRITGGRYRGRTLTGPPDRRVRPTSDRTRQAIFNILEHRDFGFPFGLENCAAADLFGGGVNAGSR